MAQRPRTACGRVGVLAGNAPMRQVHHPIPDRIQEQTGGPSGTSQHAGGLELGSAAAVTGELNHVFALRLALQPPSHASSVPSLLHAIAGPFTTRGGGAKAAAIAAASAKELRRMGPTSGLAIGPMMSGSAVCLQTTMLGYFAATAGRATSKGRRWRSPPSVAAVPPGRMAPSSRACEPTRPLEQLRRGTPWCWVVCEACLHRRPMAFVPLIIRWGPDASSYVLRKSARCSKCGRKGASLQHPSWAGSHVGWESFPVSR
jgi:hypothetical protein